MAEQASPDNKREWLIIFSGFVASILILGLPAFFNKREWISGSQTVSVPLVNSVRYLLIAIAAACLLASVIWMLLKANSKTELMAPKDFRPNSIVALAFSEYCAIFGLILFKSGGTFRDFLPFAIATLSVDLLFILPRGLKYWSSWEQQEKAKGRSSNSPFSQSL